MVDLGNAVKIGPSPLALITRADVLMANGEYHKAETDCTNALTARPGWGLLYLLRGHCRKAKKDYPGALRDYDRMRECQPELAGASYHSRAKVWEVQNNDIQALSELTAAIKHDPKFAPAYGSRGEVLKRTGKDALAVDDFTKALELLPTYIPALMNRADSYTRAGRPAEALKDLEALRAQLPTHPVVLVGLGNAYSKLQRHAEAERVLLEATQRAPGYARAFRCLGDAYHADDKCEKANMPYRRSIELDKDQQSGYTNFGRCLHQRRNYDEAVNLYGEYLLRHPKNVSVLGNRAYSYFMRAQNAVGDPAATDLRRAIVDCTLALASREETRIIGTRADSLRCLGEFSEALSDYSRLVELTPESPAGRYHRSGVLLKLQRPREALVDLDHLAKKPKVSPVVFWRRGEAWSQLNEKARSLEDFKRAIVTEHDADQLFSWSKSLYDSGHPATAAEGCLRALNTRLRFNEAELLLGLCLEKLGDTEGSRKRYETVLGSDAPESLKAVARRSVKGLQQN